MKLISEPAQTAIDQQATIRLEGAEPGCEITLRLETLDALGIPWASWARFKANEKGEVDVATQCPVNGSYSGIDGMGLLWSLTPRTRARTVFSAEPLGTIDMTLRCEGPGNSTTSLQIARKVASAVYTQAVREEGLFGTFFCQESVELLPGIVILPGSDGRLKEAAAALLASHGYAVLALAYFGYQGLPDFLVEIPLEYFRRALDWLKGLPQVNEAHLGVIGLSRGAELALLLGATYPDIRAVVAGSPSGITHAGLVGTQPSSRSAWSLDGRAIPSSRMRVNPWHVILIWGGLIRHLGSMPLRPLFQSTLGSGEASTIKVEQINGPVLLISGDDDGLWPATIFAEMVMARLRDNGHPYPDEHIRFEKAGHFVCFPYSLPGLPPMVAPIRRLYFGGSREANAHAAIASWRKILSFLQEAFEEKKDSKL